MQHDSLTAQSNIRSLPGHLVDQIKAGEVIERPANLIKEILENALDAGASEIELRLEGGGLDLVQCVDNGTGMGMEDLPLAFLRHATSKIGRFEDLYALETFGFRGEALASMASISRVTCSSHNRKRADGSFDGGRIEIHGGKTIAHLPSVGRRTGTNLSIKNLFYNTPARLKFVRSQAAEKNAIKRALNAFLLANPKVEFRIRWDQKEKQVFPATEDLEERLQQTLSRKGESAREFHFFEGEYEDHRISGYFSAQGKKGSSGKHHFLFVGGRVFFDRSLHYNILQVLEGHWAFGESGDYVCFIEVPKKLLDVNVHPNKTQVKFFKHHVISGLIGSTLQQTLAKHVASREYERTTPASLDKETLQEFLREREHCANTPEMAPHVQGPRDGEIVILSGRFYLEKKEHGFVLCDFAGACVCYLKKHFPSRVNEACTTPLIIAEAFSLDQTWDETLQRFGPLGFHFERMDAGTVLLKSVPGYLDAFEPRPVVECLLDACGKHLREIPAFESLSPDRLNSLAIYPSPGIRRKLAEELGEKTFQSFQKQLDDASLSELWKGNEHRST